ncbi:hypothetical protein, partial [Accumulibacter sp.]|uniref:hypothetical protein n=1 Tax=Accumulibacter sp. TaxID=2053492 RepID=UPI002C5EEEAF
MTLDDLRELLLVSPTAGAAESALATLIGLSRDGDADATAAVLKAMAAALGQPPSAALSPCLRAWQAAQLPREFLANAASFASCGMASTAADFAALQRLVRTRHVLQDEALKAHMLLALAEVITMQAGMDLLPGGRFLSILERVLVNTRVIAGDEANDSLQFGRGLILGKASWPALRFIIVHELGHRLLELLQSSSGSRGAAAEESDESHAAALRTLAEHLPQLLQDACRLRGKKIGPVDPRSCKTSTGVRLLASHEELPGGAYFHLSLTRHSGPIDLALAARYAHFVLTVAGADPTRAAAAYSPRGAMHFGFTGDESALPAAVATGASISEWIAAPPADGLAWLAGLQSERRFGHAEHELPETLGVVPPQTRFHGARSEPTANDLNLMAQAHSAGVLDSAASDALEKLGHEQTLAVLAATWRCAEAALLQRILDTRPALAAELRATPWPLGDIGSSLCAQRGGQVSTCHGPSAADIAATLRALHTFGVPLDAP